MLGGQTQSSFTRSDMQPDQQAAAAAIATRVAAADAVAEVVAAAHKSTMQQRAVATSCARLQLDTWRQLCQAV